ncbi:MAG: protein arginine kinase [Parachlamydiales bacterium]|nr:protein arginine kinase [Parachlamydiales bacterium]
MENSQITAFLLENHPWAQSSNPIWLATTYRLHRNLSKYHFPAKLDAATQQQVMQFILAATKSYTTLYLKAEDLSPLNKQLLYEHFLAAQAFQQSQTGEGFAIDEKGELFFLFNAQDHLQIQLNDASNEIEKGWNRLSRIDTDLSKVLHFAFSPRFGYLTANPDQCGTALITSLYLHVPALIHTDLINETLNKYSDDRVMVSSLQGSATDLIGDIVTLQNHYKLGISEEEIISSLRTFGTKLVNDETSARQKIKKDNSALIKNKVSRAYGLVKHSYELDTAECLSAISLCKLGVDLEWIKGVSQKDLNHLLFNCQRAHLLAQLKKEDLSQQELLVQRAQFIHDHFNSSSLAI